MAKPKLCLIPSAQGDKFYSVLPSSGVGDFDFSRSGGATRINSQGLIETVADGVSRLNYPLIDGVVKGCPYHILEPQSTNAINYSEDFTQTTWSKVNLSVTSNNSISPDGSLNASLITSTANGSYLSDSLTSYDPSTFSLFVKYVDHQFIQLYSGASGNFYATFDIKNSVVGANGAATDNVKIDNYGNGWFRISCVFSGVAAGSTARIGFAQSLNSTWGGLNTSFGTSFLSFGSQFESNSYLTSYIKTTSAAVTRSAETANGSGDAATFNDSEGVLFAEVSKDKGTQYSLISLQKSSVSDTYAYIGYLNNNTTIRGQIKVGGTIVLDEEIEMSDTSIVAKILIKYKSGDYSMWVNGFEVGSNTNSTIFSDGDLNEIELGINNNNGLRFYGKTKQLQYYDTALNSEDLEKLTSWVSFSDMAEGQLYSVE